MFERKILHVELVCAHANGKDVSGGLTYTMTKDTPFGMMTATITYSEQQVLDQGIEVLDGTAMCELAREVNNEETARFLEIGANTGFANLLEA